MVNSVNIKPRNFMWYKALIEYAAIREAGAGAYCNM